jgi:hypothetical protein
MGTVGTIFATKENSMKFVWHYIRRKLRDLEDCPEPPELRLNSGKHGTVRVRDDFEAEEGLNMQVHKAIGGRIVSFNHYDRKTDRSYRKVYVIQDELDFERELGKIITMESMRG